MIKKVLSMLAVVVLGGGLIYALLNAFDGDVSAMITWAWEGILGIWQAVGDWLSSNKAFSDFVKP